MENSLYIYHMVVPLRYYTYDLHNGANKLLASDEIEAITKAVMDISTMVDREKRNRVCSALKQTLGNLTDIGRKEKLVHILHQMGIREIKNCGRT